MDDLEKKRAYIREYMRKRRLEDEDFKNRQRKAGRKWRAKVKQDPEKKDRLAAANKEHQRRYRLKDEKLYYANLKGMHLYKSITPNWADKEELVFIYQMCPEGWHVDHIIPRNGKTVCGLHTPNNLQYLKAEDNRAKKNAYNPDCL